MKKKIDDWFKIKKYPHIGLPLDIAGTGKEKIKRYITNPSQISKHAFLPFIHKTSRVKKFRKTYVKESGQFDKKYIIANKKLRKADEKKRELYYSSHLDSLVFSYYSSILSKKYEKKLIENNIQDVVTAYRTIPLNPANKNSSNKCNIDFANEVFNYIRNYTEDEFLVIAYDISSFFDNLDHKILRDGNFSQTDPRRSV